MDCPGPLKTHAAFDANPDPPHAGPRYADASKRWNDGVRKAGLPEK